MILVDFGSEVFCRGVASACGRGVVADTTVIAVTTAGGITIVVDAQGGTSCTVIAIAI